jgi:hypothetical protein
MVSGGQSVITQEHVVGSPQSASVRQVSVSGTQMPPSMQV